MDNRRQPANKNWRLSTSNLRLLLRYDVTTSIEQFARIHNSNTDYIWNRNTDNIIATIRFGNKKLIRYRPASWYAATIEAYASSIGAICLPSTNVGRRHRRIRRAIGDSGTRRNRVLRALAKTKGIDHLHDALTWEPKPKERKRQPNPLAPLVIPEFSTPAEKATWVRTQHDLIAGRKKKLEHLHGFLEHEQVRRHSNGLFDDRVEAIARDLLRITEEYKWCCESLERLQLMNLEVMQQNASVATQSQGAFLTDANLQQAYQRLADQVTQQTPSSVAAVNVPPLVEYTGVSPGRWVNDEAVFTTNQPPTDQATSGTYAHRLDELNF
jgi:hypothetical protein